LNSGVTEIAIVGLGPWGLAFLERLVALSAVDPQTSPVVAHVIDPGAPGCGAFETDLPDYLILNTPCGWHSVAPVLDPPHPGDERLGLLDWLVERNYRWEGDRCVPGGTGRPIGADDFLPRRVMGAYLEWSFHVLLASAPAHLSIVHHQTAAVDVLGLPTGRECVTLDTGVHLEVDHVVLATGHTPNTGSGDYTAAVTQAIDPYPVENYEAIPPGASVAVLGLGLVAMDVMVALTVGRGGTFEGSPRADNRLRYKPNGTEPILHMFSRTGYPYCARDSRGRSNAAPYQPVICTPEAVAALKHRIGPGNVDARRDFLPLLFAEMQVRYYTRAATMLDDAAMALEIYATLAAAWRAGDFTQSVGRYSERFGDFDAEAHFFVGTDAQYVNGKDYEQQVYEIAEADLEHALNGGAESPVKAAYGIPRQLRDVIRSVVDGSTLTADSARDFQRNIRPRIARLIAGPPVLRIQQFLALIDAGIVRLEAGPAPSVELSDTGAVVIRSGELKEPTVIAADRFVRGTLEDPALSRSVSPVLASLYTQGRLRPLPWTAETGSGVHLTPELNPVNRVGEAEPTLWVMGSLTEGARYYTGYIPSPRDMSASRDAARCVQAMLKASR
jgi:uncharacterized NAD(P)/FAD-binding protein YdhS